jgi:hypothetical protein
MQKSHLHTTRTELIIENGLPVGRPELEFAIADLLFFYPTPQHQQRAENGYGRNRA